MILNVLSITKIYKINYSNIMMFLIWVNLFSHRKYVSVQHYSTFNNCVCTGRVPDPTSLFPPDLILYVNLVSKGAPKFLKTLEPRLTVLDIPYFADAYSRTVRPIDLHNF